MPIEPLAEIRYGATKQRFSWSGRLAARYDLDNYVIAVDNRRGITELAYGGELDSTGQDEVSGGVSRLVSWPR